MIYLVALKRAGWVCLASAPWLGWEESASEAVEGTSLPLESVDNIHGGHGLPLGVLSVGDSVPDDVLQEHLQHTPGLLVDQPRDPLDASTSGQAADGRLGDALDIITENLPVTLSTPLAKTLSSFATSSHCCRLMCCRLVIVATGRILTYSHHDLGMRRGNRAWRGH